MEGLDKVVKAFGTKRTDIWSLDFHVRHVHTAKNLEEWKDALMEVKDACNTLLEVIDEEE